MRRKTHILVVDDEGIARDGLCALLQREDELHVDGAFSSGREAVRTRGDLRPNVVIIDFPTAMRTGPQTISHVKRRWPGARVLVLSGSRDGQGNSASGGSSPLIL